MPPLPTVDADGEDSDPGDNAEADEVSLVSKASGEE